MFTPGEIYRGKFYRTGEFYRSLHRKLKIKNLNAVKFTPVNFTRGEFHRFT